MHHRRYCFCVLCAVAAAILAAMLLGVDSSANAQPPKPVSFIQEVAPILKESCFACHDAKKRSGKYDMTTFEKLMAGGPSGEPIIAGKVNDSEFHDLIVTKEERRMPPRDKGEAVPAAKAKIIESWIQQGAKLDAGIDAKADLLKELRVRWQPPMPPAAYKFPAVVNSLAFAPDNASLVVGGHHELTVWSIPEGNLTQRIRTRAERAYAMAFLPDGTLAVAGGRPGQEGDVRIYNLAAKPAKTEAGVAFLDGVSDKSVLVKSLLGVEDSVLCLALSADGKTLAAGGCDRTIRLWNLESGKIEQTIENHADWVLGIALTHDGKYLVSAGRDKTSKVWDLKAKESVYTFPDHQNIVYAVAVNKASTQGFSVGADRVLRSWKLAGEAKPTKPNTFHSDEVFKIAVSSKDGMIATASADKSVRLWDAAGTASKTALQGLTDYAFAVAFSPNGSLVAGGDYAGEVVVWNPSDAKVVVKFNASPGFTAPVPVKK